MSSAVVQGRWDEAVQEQGDAYILKSNILGEQGGEGGGEGEGIDL